jgi:hypothetical protein
LRTGFRGDEEIVEVLPDVADVVEISFSAYGDALGFADPGYIVGEEDNTF